jgi:hypothetical protein
VYCRKAALCCAFLWAKGPNAEDIHKEMYPVHGGKCLSRKAFHSWVEKRDKYFADDEEFETEATVKDFCAVGFEALVKRWGKCISVCGRYVEK